ncbi:MAG TPA: TolC family protein [Polyangiaceae bacterium]|nr:TolC family protein [Polyangiaceae bacterium]
MSLRSICLLGLPILWGLSIRDAAAQTTPETRAAAQAAQAARQEGEARAELPPPEVMLEIWRVPVKRPYAINDADMIRFGVEQELSAPGERAALRRAASLRALSARAEGDAKARALSLRLAHAQVERAGAERSHQVHLAHLQLARRTLELARARHAAGGPLADVSTLEVEAARATALVAADEARVQTSQALLQALRDAGPLEPVRERPELASLRSMRDAELAEADAEHARSRWPEPRIGVSYFAPSGQMQGHGFGISLGMQLPWLWGGRGGSQLAAESRSRALSQDLVAKQRDIAIEVIATRGAASAVQSELTVLREAVLPATLRARTLAEGAYQSGQARLQDVLQAEAQQVEVEMQIVELETELAHRTTDLEFALGQKPSRPAPAEKKP